MIVNNRLLFQTFLSFYLIRALLQGPIRARFTMGNKSLEQKMRYYIPLPDFDDSFIKVDSIKTVPRILRMRSSRKSFVDDWEIPNDSEKFVDTLVTTTTDDVAVTSSNEDGFVRIAATVLDKSKFRGREPEEYSAVADLLSVLEKEISLGSDKKLVYKEWDGLFENDIVLTHKTALHILKLYRGGKATKQLTAKQPTWRGISPIPYKISDLDSPSMEEVIDKAVALWEKETCIRFEKTTEGKGDHLHFFSGAGCWSYIGKTGNEQMLSVSTRCPRVGEVAHEIGHALGLWHEQSRPDRDFYVDIVYENVESGGSRNFAKIGRTDSKPWYMPYDLSSIMHYDSLALSGNNKPTLRTKLPRLQPTMGNREYLTFTDAKIINNEYCLDTCGYVYRASKCLRNGYPDPNNCTKCKCPDGFGGYYCDLVMKVNEDCGSEILRQRQGLIKLSNEDGNDTQPLSCSWLIQARPCQVISMEVMEVNIGGVAEDGIRCLDWIEVRTEADLSLTGERMCGNHLPENKLFQSKGSEMLILYRINHPYNNTANATVGSGMGFTASYRIDNKPYCHNPFYGFTPKDHGFGFNSVSISNLYNIKSL